MADGHVDRREIAELTGTIRTRDAAKPNVHPAPPTAAVDTMAGMLLTDLGRRYEPLYRRDQLVWSKVLGRAVDLREASQGPATPLLKQLLMAKDCPLDRDGSPSQNGVLRVWRQHLGVAWADLLATLPDETATAELDASAEEELRQHLAALLGRVVTIGRRIADQGETDVQSRSMFDCCLSWAVPGLWSQVRSYWIWTRLDGNSSLPSDPAQAKSQRR